jgi:hypothetical protein
VYNHRFARCRPVFCRHKAPGLLELETRARYLVVMGAAACMMAAESASSQITPRVGTVKSENPVAVTGARPGAATEPLGESWPQRFEVLSGEAASYAFLASQPGPITITVQAQGRPVTVSLSGPVAQPIEQSGSGTVTLAYTATASDVAKSSVWVVRIREQGTSAMPQPRPVLVSQPSPPGAMTARPTPTAVGTIAVTHPAGDLGAAKASVSKETPVKSPPPPPLNIGQQFLEQRKSQYTQARSRAQTVLPQRITQIFQAASARPAGNGPPQAMHPGAVPQRNAAMAGTSPNHAAPPNALGIPVIDSVSGWTVDANGEPHSLSGSRGQPGDWLIVWGPFVDDCNTQIHFVLSPTTDVAVNYYENGYYRCTNSPMPGVSAQVPNVTGLMPYDGQVYVVHAGHASRKVPFHFDPGIDFAQLAPLCNDPAVQLQGNSDADCPVIAVTNVLGMMYYPADWDKAAIVRVSLNDPLGHKGEDIFYSGKVLKNGWLMDSVNLTCGPDYTYSSGFTTNSYPCTQAYVLASGVGTPSPFVIVHWWLDALNSLPMRYKVFVNIKGPMGVPYQ